LALLAFLLKPFLLNKEPKNVRLGSILNSTPISSIASGTKLSLSFNTDKIDDFDSVTVSIANLSFKVINGATEITTAGLPLGGQNAQINLWDNGKNKSLDYPFTIVSDISVSQANFTTVNTTSRDAKTYTQGYEINNGVLYESGGQYGESLIRMVNPKTLQSSKSVSLTKEFFAEGLTVLGDKIYQITWKEGMCFIYDKSLNLLSKVPFASSTGEGWGLTNDGKNLILSDGSSKISYLDPQSLSITRVVTVYAADKEVNYLNELEYVDGYIYANVYTSSQVVKFESASGKVVSIYDFSTLKQNHPKADVLNGIAYNANTKTFLITGKYWDKVYEVKL
jgi:glutaminyl-peptide cyclotransferase